MYQHTAEQSGMGFTSWVLVVQLHRMKGLHQANYHAGGVLHLEFHSISYSTQED